ncbi:MAG TPA: hypothetical protein VHV51_07535 [Polyangiaceae bacterium]|nr:hypothetical protein [Polyangiaceae bacterium]
MFVRKLAQCSLLAALAVPLALSVSACGNSGGAQHAEIKAGEMPAGGEWQGVYYSPVYGYLHIVTEGKTAQGAWRTGGGDAYGELQGETDGNILRYSWTQHKIGMVGAEADSKGNGYFKYSIPKQGEAHKISGEWGLGDSNAGNSWEAVKQTNMQPNLQSVKPDEIEGKVNAGGWDSDDKSGGDKKKDDGDTPSP